MFLSGILKKICIVDLDDVSLYKSKKFVEVFKVENVVLNWVSVGISVNAMHLCIFCSQSNYNQLNEQYVWNACNELTAWKWIVGFIVISFVE